MEWNEKKKNPLPFLQGPSKHQQGGRPLDFGGTLFHKVDTATERACFQDPNT